MFTKHRVVDNGKYLTLTNVRYHGERRDISWSKQLGHRGESRTISTWLREWAEKVPDGHAYAVTFAALPKTADAEHLMQIFSEDFAESRTEHVTDGDKYLMSATNSMLTSTIVHPHSAQGAWSLFPETQRPHRIIHRARSKQEVHDKTVLNSRKFRYCGHPFFPEGYGLGKRVCSKLLGPVPQRDLARGVHQATKLEFLLDYELSPGPRMDQESENNPLLSDGPYRPHFLTLLNENGTLRFWLRPTTSNEEPREYYGGRVRTFRLE